MSDARTWGGMHFRSCTAAGFALGRGVADAIASRHFQPIERRADAR